MNCDFCGAETTKDELTIVPVNAFRIPAFSYVNLSWGWGGCRTCGDLLRAQLWDALLERAITHHEHGEVARPILTAVYAGLRANQNGPLRTWNSEVDEQP